MTRSAPVIFLVFNRPDLTERTFETIRSARPSRLLVVADGPRPDRPHEAALCAAARAVTERVDWPCEVSRDYSDANLGCGRRVASGISRGFELFEEAIVLEDDCLPHPSFFQFCGEMLTRYRDDERVMHITGTNLQDGRRRGEYGYYFSKYPLIWGWATWRRAWQYYDFKVSEWPPFQSGGYLRAICPDPIERAFWAHIFAKMASDPIDTWDYQWTFACWRQSGLTATPQINLISNIGFRADATHTHTQPIHSRLITGESEIDDHIPAVVADVEADEYLFDNGFGGASLRVPLRPFRLTGPVRRMWNKLVNMR